MPNQQRTLRIELNQWKRTYRTLKHYGSKAHAVSQLVGFAKEMEAEFNGELPPAMPLELAHKLAQYNKNRRDCIAEQIAKHTRARELAPVENEIVGDVDQPERDLPVDFSGVGEGRGMETAVIPPPPVVRSVSGPPNFPDEAELTLIAACPNPRLLQGQLPDGRKVSVWKGPRHWRIPSKVVCRKDPATPANNPAYLPV